MQAAFNKPTATDMLASITPADTSLLLMRSAILGIKLKRSRANASDCAIKAGTGTVPLSSAEEITIPAVDADEEDVDLYT